jgi:hypothetical protein
MLRNARAPTLRIRLASVLGLLIRHATYIADELAQTSVVEILTEALKVSPRCPRSSSLQPPCLLPFFFSPCSTGCTFPVPFRAHPECPPLPIPSLDPALPPLSGQEREGPPPRHGHPGRAVVLHRHHPARRPWWGDGARGGRPVGA